MKSTNDTDNQGNRLIFDDVMSAASVTLTEAVAYDLQSGKYSILQAKDYNAEEHSHMQFFCKHCFDDEKKIGLSKPTKGYTQNIHFKLLDAEDNVVIDPETNKPIYEAEKFYFPPHFSTLAGQKHGCTVAHQHEKLNDILERVAQSTEGQTTICSVNIDCGQTPPASLKSNTRSKINILQSDLSGEHRQIVRGPTRAHSISDLQQIAQMLDHTSADTSKRKHIILQIGRTRATLDSLYHHDAAKMLHALQAEKMRPVLFALQLDTHKKPEWHSPQGKAPYLVVRKSSDLHDGVQKTLTLKVAFDDPNVELAMKTITDKPDGPLDFLIYAERIEIKPHKNQVKLVIGSANQIGRWSPVKQFDHEPEFKLVRDEVKLQPEFRHS